MMLNKSVFILITCLFFFGDLAAQPSTYVDEYGVMRWTETKEEVIAFGVNYSEPFSSWRQHEMLGIPHQKAIDADIYHIARMGLDGYRIHVWETYICDYDGNLIYNKHFQLFDYLLFKLKERNIKIFLTPMNYYGGSDTGFHNKYGGKKGCLTDTASFPAQENYLAQFVSHVNPYTGIAYKDDPDIIGFEINNEPIYRSLRPDLTREYINRMSAAIRSAGCEKPLFYNVSHNIDQIDNFCADEIDGGTFQWYPASLNGNKSLKGNYLPNVEQYVIPFADHDRFKNMSKICYELSPADVGRSSHLYPAMARSFREAGFLFAAQFAYSPMATAYANIEYTTHYVSLPYAPGKSMGMVIAKEVFHNVPLGKNYGRYPNNNRFDEFRVSYEDDLAEMVSDEKFLYTNDTKTLPPSPDKLLQVAGTGSSSIVKYPGTGTYFLDKLEDGVWRLEVMPDAIWVNDPHFTTSLDKEVSVIQWREWPMELNLPNISENFSIVGLNEGNAIDIHARGIIFPITPGAYLLTREGKTSNWNGNDRFNNIRLNEFYAPEPHCKKTYVIHEAPLETTKGSKLSLTAKIVSPEGPEKVELILVKPDQNKAIPMVEIKPYHYSVEVPVEYLESPGLLRYYITVGNGEVFETFPSGFTGNHPLSRRIRPGHTNFLPATPFEISIVNEDDPICLFDGSKDWEKIIRMRFDAKVEPVPSPNTGRILAHINLTEDSFGMEYNELTNRHYCRERIESRMDDLAEKDELVVLGKALNGKPCVLELALVMRDASVYGGTLTLKPEEDSYSLSLNDFIPLNMRIIPVEIPGFQPNFFQTQKQSKFMIEEVESLQISIVPGIPGTKLVEEHGVAVERILLQ